MKQTNWKAGQNIMTYMFTIWLVLSIFFEILESQQRAGSMEHQPYTLCADTFNMRLCCSARCPHKKRHRAAINQSGPVFVLVFTIKGYWQKNYGFSSKDLYFLHVLGGWRTHIIWSGIRYFSCFSDAANYGVHAAMSAVVFAISAFFVESKWLRIYFLCIAVGATLRNGYFGNPCSYGSHHGRNVDDNRHCQKLESVIGRYYSYPSAVFVFLQLYQYRKWEPIYPQDALLFPSI